ncbi:hypothetical protein [Pseudomonas fluorescens]|nr:hypothetical protein [Pseudomonas fluorescens]
MSLSINNSPSMKLDTARDEVPSSTPSKSSLPLSTSKTDSAWTSSALFPDNARTTRGEMMISAGALSKLFDMLEQVFKSMREVILGKNVTPQPAIPSDKALKATPDSSDPLKMKADAATLPKASSDSADPQKMKADAGTLPRTTSASTDPQKVKVNADPSDTTSELKVKIDHGLLPGTSHKPTSHVSTAVPVPSVNVSNDSNAQVKVELNIGRCHCPDTPVEHDRGRLKTVPDAAPNPVPMPKAEVTPQPEARVPDTKPGVQPKPALIPKAEVTPQPEARVPDTKPGVQPKPALIPKAEVTPQPEVKVPGSHPGVLHKPEPVPLPGVVPQPDMKVVPPTDTKPTVTPDQPKPEPDVTSPGPAEKDNDLKGWSFINRRRLKN